MIYFVIPVFNESPNIQGLAANLKQLLPGEEKHVVIVDDGSTDDTVDMVGKHFAGVPHTLLKNPVNSGPGYSFNSGFSFVLDRADTNLDLVVSMEGDNTSDLSILPLMKELASKWNYDLVLASVYAQGGGFSKTSFFRKLISVSANQIMRIVFGINVLTLSSFYRVYRPGLLQKMRQQHTPLVAEKGFLCALELLLKSIQANARIIEVPMVLKMEERKGKSKMKVIRTASRYSVFLLKHLFTNKA